MPEPNIPNKWDKSGTTGGTLGKLPSDKI